jgi:hypothetical protein
VNLNDFRIYLSGYQDWAMRTGDEVLRAAYDLNDSRWMWAALHPNTVLPGQLGYSPGWPFSFN